MSWVDELRARAPGPVEVAREMAAAARGYASSGLPWRRVAGFTGLWLVQRVGYWVGWQTSRRRGTDP